MENNKPLLDYMADMILEDSEKLGTFWCNGCLHSYECNYQHPRDCVIDFCKKKVSENIDENVRR